MSSDPTAAYFDDIISRAVGASVTPSETWFDARRNECHENCERFILQFDGYAVVRGWLVGGGHWLIPHSVVRRVSSGALTDITPGDDKFPFVEHQGSEQDFTILRQGRDGGWLHPAPTM
jgi:hypothetical protein